MAKEFKLPEVSEGVAEADISEIMVAEGDVIEADQVVMEVETDKAVAPVECPFAGKITKVHVKEGDTVPIGATLLTIEETAEAKKADGKPAGGGGKAEKAEKPAPQKESKPDAGNEPAEA
ncbi:MAG TPA: biotin/lipoyl-containing protein, partial [Planctomycetaceae bacterium]